MYDESTSYVPPTIVEVGDFAKNTLGCCGEGFDWAYTSYGWDDS